MLIHLYQTIRLHVPEDTNLQNQRHENLKPRKYQSTSKTVSSTKVLPSARFMHFVHASSNFTFSSNLLLLQENQKRCPHQRRTCIGRVIQKKKNKPHYIVQFWITADLSTQITERTILPIPYEYNASFVTACWCTILRNTPRPTVLGRIALLSASAFPISLINLKKKTYSVYHKLR